MKKVIIGILCFGSVFFVEATTVMVQTVVKEGGEEFADRKSAALSFLIEAETYLFNQGTIAFSGPVETFASENDLSDSVFLSWVFAEARQGGAGFLCILHIDDGQRPFSWQLYSLKSGNLNSQGRTETAPSPSEIFKHL